MNLYGCKWLNKCFVYAAGKAKPTCESITCSKQMRVTGSTKCRGRILWAGLDSKGIPKNMGFQLNLKGFRVEFRQGREESSWYKGGIQK